MSKGIRRYGPGKYNLIVDSYVHSTILEGMGDESCGDVSEIGWAADSVLLGPDSLEEIERIASEDKSGLRGGLTDEERDLLKESYGAIVVENDQGFVSVDYYDNKKEFDKDWAEVQDDAEGDDEEGEEEEEEEEESETEDAETEEAE